LSRLERNIPSAARDPYWTEAWRLAIISPRLALLFALACSHPVAPYFP